MDQTDSKLPQMPEPYWRSSVDLQTFPKLTSDQTVDVAIVGGGITGITAAYKLSKEGVKVALIDAGTILNGTTGHTTAKITSQHGLIYDQFISDFGEENAKLYYESTANSLEFIRETIHENNIECDLTEEDAYIYTNSDEYISKLEKEFAAYQKLGINGELHDSIPLPFLEVKRALSIKNQAQYHPLKYLNHLTKIITDNGGSIYENTTAVDIENGPKPTVITRDGLKINCNYVIVASHFPFNDFTGAYFARMYADRSYILGVTVEEEFPGGMYLSAESPSRSLRYTEMNGEKLILVSGESHKTGQGISTIKHYEALEQFSKEIFKVKEIPYRWSAQDYTTLDKLPYIGHATSIHENILIGTGYFKWGMTNGTTAGLLLSDIVLNRENPYKELFSPQRFNADKSITKFVSINADVAKHLIKGKLENGNKSPEELAAGEGSVVSFNGKRAGAFKNKDGELFVVDTTCTHMGCEVEWNSGDCTWDCPCHGSRFSYEGEVVEGPAKKPLKRIE
ncbi:FAD-dependent oxidoreductase [Cytobacillus suaedae]|nr:FAD-dependent oxidoreductase [Cytobacillus suaedae]